MKIYGRPQKQDSELNNLVEATVVADPEALRDLASFLYRCADEIEDQGSEWEQAHFESNEVTAPEIIVFNPDLLDD